MKGNAGRLDFLRKARLIAALLAALAVSGCDQLDKIVDRILYEGTHIGVQRCIERNKTEMISEKIIMDLCIKEHEIQIYAETDGRAGYRKNFALSDELYYFSGILENTSDKYVITSFKVTVVHEDMEEGESDEKVFGGHWIEPKQSVEFKIGEDELSFQPKKNRIYDGDKSLFNWTPITYGVRISLR